MADAPVGPAADGTPALVPLRPFDPEAADELVGTALLTVRPVPRSHRPRRVIRPAGPAAVDRPEATGPAASGPAASGPAAPVAPGGRRRRLRKRTLRGMLVMGLSMAGQAVLQLVFLAVIARVVSPAQFGLVAGALVAVNLTTVLAESGIGAAVVQRAELTRDHLRVGWTLSAALGIVCWAVLFGLAPQIEDLLRLPGLAPLLRVLALVFVVNGLTLSDYLLSRRLQFGRLAGAEIAAYAIGYGGVAITLAQLGLGAWAIVWGQLAQSVVRTVLVTCLAPAPTGISFARGPLGQLLNFGGGYSLGRVALWAATQVDNLVVGRYLGPAALGLYGRAYQLVQMPANLLGQVANEVLFPALAAVQDQQATLRRVFRLGVGLLAALALPISVVAAVTSKPLVLLLLGRDWLPLRAAFDVIIFGLLFRTSSKLTDALTKARGAVYRRGWRSVVFAASVFVGALVGQHWGLHGVATGVLAALALNYVLTNQLCVVLTGLSWRDFALAHVPAASLTIVAGAVALGVDALVRPLQPSPVLHLLPVWTAAVLADLAFVRLAAHLPGARPMIDLVAALLDLLPRRAARPVIRLLGRRYAPVRAPAEVAAAPGGTRPVETLAGVR